MSNYITKVQKGNTVYSLHDPDIAQAVAEATQAKNNAQAAATSAGNSAALTAHLLGLETIPLWDGTHVENPTASDPDRVNYYKDTLVRRTPTGETKDHVYRAANDIMFSTGATVVAWDDDDWIDTSVWAEISNMRAGASEVEHVRIFAKKYDFGVATPVVGATVSVTYDANTTTYTTDSDGTVEFDVPIGKSYTATISSLTGYYTPSGKMIVANMSDRVLQFNYSLVKSGLYIVDNNGNEYTLSEWQAGLSNNTLSNTNAVFVKYYTATCHFAVSKNYTSTYWKAFALSPLNSVLLTGDAAYAGNDTSTYKYGNSIANGGHTTSDSIEATTDYDMVDATTQIISLGRLWQMYNGYENQGEAITIYDESGIQQQPQKYLTLAACYVRTAHETINGQTFVGNLATVGVFVAAIMANSMINEALNVIKGTNNVQYVNFGNDMITSTQYNASTHYFTNSNNIGTNQKSNGKAAFPFFYIP